MMAGPDLLADLCSVQLRVSPSPSPVSQPLLCLITINIYYYKQIIFDISYYQQYCYILSINNTHSGMAGWLADAAIPLDFFGEGNLTPSFFCLFPWPGGGGGGKSLAAYSCFSCSLHFGCVLVCRKCCCFFLLLLSNKWKWLLVSGRTSKHFFLSSLFSL